MARYISRRDRVAATSLKRRGLGTVIRHHDGEDIKFTRVTGGWRRERKDVTSERPTVVSSAEVARECNHAFGCKESWARVY